MFNHHQLFFFFFRAFPLMLKNMLDCKSQCYEFLNYRKSNTEFLRGRVYYCYCNTEFCNTVDAFLLLGSKLKNLELL